MLPIWSMLFLYLSVSVHKQIVDGRWMVGSLKKHTLGDRGLDVPKSTVKSYGSLKSLNPMRVG